MRGPLLVLLLPLATACTSTTRVQPAALVPMRNPTSDRAMILKPEEGGKVRVDANSRIRFRRHDGRWTAWMRVGDLNTGQDGLFIRRWVKLKSLPMIEGRNLMDADREHFAHASGVRTSADPQHVLLTRPEGFRTLAARAKSKAPLSGHWRAQLPDQSWTGWMDGATLLAARTDGLELESGVGWQDIAEAEVRNFSGGKTLGLIVGSAAIVATLVALRADGCCHSLGAATAVTSLRTGAYVGSVLSIDNRPIPYRGGAWRPPSETLQPNLQESTSGTTRLFSGVTRRRAHLEVVPSLQSMATLSAPEGLEQTGALSLRLAKVWEFGGGLRAAGLAAPGAANPELRFIGFGRAGLHLNLDADHRVAVPLSLDFGAGQEVLFQTRLNLGVRVRITDTFTVGLSLPSPTLTRMRGPVPDSSKSRWSFPAGLELAFAL